MQQLITILHLLIAVLLVILVLIQRGKGAEMGAGFGSGASGTMFGSQGATPFLVKLTGGLALLFFLSSAILSFVVGRYATHQAEGMPFITDTPVKTLEAIPVSKEVQQETAASTVVPATPIAVPSALKEKAATKRSAKKETK